MSISADVTERKRMEEELHRYRMSLESQVRERTAELSAANAAMAVEIAERKRTEYALLESEATARALLSIPNAAAFLLDREEICLDANDTLGSRFSKSITEIIGKPIWDLFPKDVAEKRKAHFMTILANKKQVRYEDERDGRWNDSIISPILDENGEVSKAIVFGFDITERKRAEDALKDNSAERLDLALRGGDLGMLDWNISTGELVLLDFKLD
jgi:PAS domain S-box-containing protein